MSGVAIDEGRPAGHGMHPERKEDEGAMSRRTGVQLPRLN